MNINSTVTTIPIGEDPGKPGGAPTESDVNDTGAGSYDVGAEVAVQVTPDPGASRNQDVQRELTLNRVLLAVGSAVVGGLVGGVVGALLPGTLPVGTAAGIGAGAGAAVPPTVTLVVARIWDALERRPT